MKVTKVLIVVSMLLNTTIASAAFVLNNPNGGNGFVVDAFPSFTLVGSDFEDEGIDVDDGDIGELEVNLTTYTDTAVADATINFDFLYFTEDIDGSNPDPAGYVINNVFTQLSPVDLAQFGEAFGSAMFSVMAGDIFGWYVDATDGILGRGILSVDVNTAPSAVPLPAASWLLLSAFAGFGLMRKKS